MEGHQPKSARRVLSQLGIEVVVDTRDLDTLRDKLKTAVAGAPGIKVGDPFEEIGKNLANMKVFGVGISKIAGFAVGMFADMGTSFLQSVATPILHFFQVQLLDAMKIGPEYMKQAMIAAIPLDLTGKVKNVQQAYAGVTSEIAKTAGQSVILPNEAAKAAFWYTRIAQQTGGLGDSLKKISALTYMTGTDSERIASLVYQWAEAFKMDIPKGASMIADQLTYILSTMGLTFDELEMVSKWVLPMFASGTGDVNKRFMEMMALIGNIAQREMGMPIQMRTIEGSLTKLLSPSAKLLALFEAQGVHLYKLKGTMTDMPGTMSGIGQKMQEQEEIQRRLNAERASGQISAEEYLKLTQKNNVEVQAAEKYAEEVFQTYKNQGLELRDTLEVFQELNKVLQRVGPNSALWGQILNDIAGGSAKSILSLVATLSDDMVKTMQKAASEGDKTTQKLITSFGQVSDYWEKVSVSTFAQLKDDLWAYIGNPIARAFWEGTSKGLMAMSNEINKGGSGLNKGLTNIAQMFDYLGKTQLEPLMEDMGRLLVMAFNPDAPMSEIEKLQGSIEVRLRQLMIGITAVIKKPMEVLANSLALVLRTAFLTLFDQDFFSYITTMLGEGLIGAVSGALKGVAGKKLAKDLFGVGDVEKAKTNWMKISPSLMGSEVSWGPMTEEFKKFSTNQIYNVGYKKFFEDLAKEQVAPDPREVNKFIGKSQYDLVEQLAKLKQELITTTLVDVQNAAKKLAGETGGPLLPGKIVSPAALVPTTVTATKTEVPELSVAELIAQSAKNAAEDQTQLDTLLASMNAATKSALDKTNAEKAFLNSQKEFTDETLKLLIPLIENQKAATDTLKKTKPADNVH